MAFNSIYVHIPFCQKRCNYCDFLSHIYSEEKKYADQYADALIAEIQLYKTDADQIKSIYFGGGTPTTLSAKDLLRTLMAIKENFNVSPKAEITVEANPATVNLEYLTELFAGGFNRLSLGVQSFQASELAEMGRLHSEDDVYQTVKSARLAGFENISVDLIYALPNQTLASWQENLQKAVALDVEHISLYSLQLDNDSIWGLKFNAGEMDSADEDLEADMLIYARDYLKTQKFMRYEIANFSKIGMKDRRSAHNRGYWQREDYLGLGLGAASCLFDKRWQNVGTLEEYTSAVLAGFKPPVEAETLTAEQCISEVMFMGLRQSAGVEMSSTFEKYGINPMDLYQQQVDLMVGNDLLEYVEDADSLKLTESGKMFANQVFERFV